MKEYVLVKDRNDSWSRALIQTDPIDAVGFTYVDRVWFIKEAGIVTIKHEDRDEVLELPENSMLISMDNIEGDGYSYFVISNAEKIIAHKEQYIAEEKARAEASKLKNLNNI